jgi:glutathione S-transferase
MTKQCAIAIFKEVSPFMPRLLHFTLDPYARRMRLALAEYGVDVDLQEERPWTPSQTVFELNPSGQTPVYIEDSGLPVSGVEALTEYLEETLGNAVTLIAGTALQRAEIRRLVAWFDVKFYSEVTEPVLTERIIRRFVAGPTGSHSPDTARMRTGMANLKPHLDYVSYLAERNSWLAGNRLSIADLAAASHLSALDYLGLVPWAEHPVAQAWYGRIKSRPSFRKLLSDSFAGIQPSAHYADLDF